MNIWGVTSTQGSQGLAALQGAEATRGTQAAVQPGVAEVQDPVTLSIDAVRAAESAGDIRFDRVQAIRAAIADGSYETPEKLDLALERLLDRLGYPGWVSAEYRPASTTEAGLSWLAELRR